MTSKKLLKFMVVSCLLIASAFTVTACKDDDGDDDVSSSMPSSSSVGSSTVLPAEMYTLSFSGLDTLESVVVEIGTVIGVLPAVPEKEGFVPNGWKIGEEKITASTIWNYSEDKVAEPVYASGTASYTVEHYLEDIETGEYQKDATLTEIKQGTVDTLVSAVILDSLVGYEKVVNHPESYEVGTVEEDGSLVLKMYYQLNRYTVTMFTYNTPEWEPIVVKHGETIEALELPVIGKLQASAWVKSGEDTAYDFTQPITGDLKLEAQYSGTVKIETKEEFLAIGEDYPEIFWDDISYILNADLKFSSQDFIVERDTGISVNSRSTGAYIVKNLGSSFNGQGHKITVEYKALDTTLCYPALFNNVSGSIENVYFDLKMDSMYEVAALARTVTETGKIVNCYIDAQLIINSVNMYTGFYGYRSAVILSNLGLIDKCVFEIYSEEKGIAQSASLAVRFQSGTISNCSVISNIVWGNATEKHGQYISSNYSNYHEFQYDVQSGNSDPNRSNCYLFEDIASLKSGEGDKYNNDGTVTAGTYADVINLYEGAYWSAWLV